MTKSSLESIKLKIFLCRFNFPVETAKSQSYVGRRLTNRRWAVGCFGWHFGTVGTEDTFGLNPRLTRWIIKAWQGDWMPSSCQLPCFCRDKTLVLMTDLDVINTIWSPSIIDEEPDRALRFLLLSVELEAWREYGKRRWREGEMMQSGKKETFAKRWSMWEEEGDDRG